MNQFSPANPQLAVAMVGAAQIPLQAALEPDRALAIITATGGAAYRPVGAAMVIDRDGRCWGQLSSGCIERDVAHHAQHSLRTGQDVALRYGRGSPFADLALPCGGSLDIRILPRPDRAALRLAVADLAARRPTLLTLPDVPQLRIIPDLRFLIFGNGPEAACFARLTDAAGYAATLYSHDEATRRGLHAAHPLPARGWPDGVVTDPRCAVVLFFHDHDHETALLAHALRGPAFFIGAQGSLRAHRDRCAALRASGLGDDQIARLAAPFGLIPSLRDARALAVSVLAHVLAQARDAGLPT